MKSQSIFKRKNQRQRTDIGGDSILQSLMLRRRVSKQELAEPYRRQYRLLSFVLYIKM